jgi:hypothetical protein
MSSDAQDARGFTELSAGAVEATAGMMHWAQFFPADLPQIDPWPELFHFVNLLVTEDREDCSRDP